MEDYVAVAFSPKTGRICTMSDKLGREEAFAQTRAWRKQGYRAMTFKTWEDYLTFINREYDEALRAMHTMRMQL